MFAADIGESRPKTKMEHPFQEPLHVPGHCGFFNSLDRLITPYLGTELCLRKHLEAARQNVRWSPWINTFSSSGVSDPQTYLSHCGEGYMSRRSSSSTCSCLQMSWICHLRLTATKGQLENCYICPKSRKYGFKIKTNHKPSKSNKTKPNQNI